MTACAAPRHHADPDPPDTEEAGHLCQPCHHQLRRDLRRFPTLAAALEDILGTATAGAMTAGDGSGLPLNMAASDCLALLRRNTVRAVKAVAEERKIPLPARTTEDGCPLLLEIDLVYEDLSYVCDWLGGHVRWVTFRPWAPALAGAVRFTRSRGEAILAPFLVKRFAIHRRCLACGVGGMVAVIYGSPGDHRWSYLTCDGCEAVVGLADWWDYGRRSNQVVAV